MSDRSQISPVPPGPTSFPSRSTTLTSTPGMPACPIEPALRSWSAGPSAVPTGPISLMP
ncbi:Uncharacterised protein [Mycobacteroides abscessus]|nr:Uncharacterised protein [Mycobacteroides abscessus]